MKNLTLAGAIGLALTLATGLAHAADPVEATRNAEAAKADAAAAEVAADVAEDRADAADLADSPDAGAAEKRADAAEDAAEAATNAAEDADESAEDVRDGDADADVEAGRARAGADVAQAGAKVAEDAAAANANPAGAGAAPAMTAEQQAMMDAWTKAGTKGPAHDQLAAFVGEWNAQVTMWMDPAAPPQVSAATETATSIYDGRFVQGKFNGSHQGQPFEGTSVMGYDNVRGKFTSTWFDSMSTGIFLSMGDYDAGSKTYTLRGTMADPMKPSELTPVRIDIQMIDDDHHTFTWHEARGGKDVKTMEIAYARK